MQSESCSCKFMLFDFGHPMKLTSMQNILCALENALIMAFACPRSLTETFGISILNTDNILFESEASLRQNFEEIFNALKASVNTSKRITVQEYKYLLSRSLERILGEFQKFVKSSNRSMNKLMQITILSKKRASTLGEIITDVSSKMKQNCLISVVKSYKIVQIQNKQDNSTGFSNKNTSIDCTVCLDSVYDICCFFKRWFLGHQQRLRILLSEELDLELHCEVDDCVVSPVTLIQDGKWEILSDVRCASKSPNRLKVVNRLPVTCSSSKYFTGIPHSITPSNSLGLNQEESQTNTKLFKQLCRKLHETGEALLAKSELPAGFLAYHLLTSDGNLLVMNDMATQELSLPPGEWAPTSVLSSADDGVASKLEACLEKVSRVSDYDPRRYSSGAYEYLKLDLEQFYKDQSEEYDAAYSNTKEEDSQTDFAQSENPTSDGGCESGRKSTETVSKLGKKEKANVHPALLSDAVLEKYRKIHAQVFKLPELGMADNGK